MNYTCEVLSKPSRKGITLRQMCKSVVLPTQQLDPGSHEKVNNFTQAIGSSLGHRDAVGWVSGKSAKTYQESALIKFSGKNDKPT